MYKVCFYVPEKTVEKVKNAMFEAGAGQIGNYDSCSWQTLGTGQFRPLKNSTPHTGQQDIIEIVAEFKVEMVCADILVKPVIHAMIKAHPYEEPAYDVYILENLM